MGTIQSEGLERVATTEQKKNFRCKMDPLYQNGGQDIILPFGIKERPGFVLCCLLCERLNIAHSALVTCDP